MPIDIKAVMSHIISGLVAGGTFLLFLFIIKLNFIISIGIGIVAYIAGLFTFFTCGKEKEPLPEGITEDIINKTIETTSEKLKTLESYLKKIQKASVKDMLEDICSSVKKIIENFKKDPKDIKAAKNFLNYYLDATINLVTKYEDLSARQVKSPNIQQTLTKAEKLLEIIGESFKKQYVKLLEDDVMNLDVEIEVLEKTLKMEGL